MTSAYVLLISIIVGISSVLFVNLWYSIDPIRYAVAEKGEDYKLVIAGIAFFFSGLIGFGSLVSMIWSLI